MTIFFANTSPIDLAAIELMGVSVKEGSSPIGYFGTGLKFAIATLLRNGQKVSLRRPDGQYRFFSENLNIRGKDFSRVIMETPLEVVPLGFTTALGRNWLLWQAYRELESNCRDERGISGKNLNLKPSDAWGTIFEIEGEEFERVWEKREEYFLSSEPILKNEFVEIHPLLRSQPSAVFYRGVLAGQLPEQSVYTYNYLGNGQLTEDRTLSSFYQLAYNAAYLVAKHGPWRVVEDVLLAGSGRFEHNNFYNWPYSGLSQTYESVIEENSLNDRLNQVALREWLDRPDNLGKKFKEVSPTAQQLETGRRAFALLRAYGVSMTFDDFKIVTGIASGAYGLVHMGQIYISPQTFDLGHRFLASTLYEEWLHKEEGLRDESRGLQNYLFEKLAATTEELMELRQTLGLPTPEVITLPRTLPTEKINDEIPF